MTKIVTLISVRRSAMFVMAVAIVLSSLAVVLPNKQAEAAITGYYSTNGTVINAPNDFTYTSAVTTDSAGDIYVLGRDSLVKYSPDRQHVLFRYSSNDSSNELINIRGATDVDVSADGTITVLSNFSYYQYRQDGSFIRKVGSIGTGPGEMTYANGIVTDSSGNVYVSDGTNNRIQKFDNTGAFVASLGTTPGAAEATGLGGLTIWNNELYVPCMSVSLIKRYSLDGTYLGSISTEVNGTSHNMNDIALGTNGDIYGSAVSGHGVEHFTNAGTYIGSIGNDASGAWKHIGSAYRVATDTQGNIYTAARYESLAVVYAADGTELAPIRGASDRSFSTTSSNYDIKLDSQGNLYILDPQNYRVLEYTKSGQFKRSIGSYGTGPGQFIDPTSVAVADDGTIYVSQTVNGRVQKFGAGGNYISEINVIAGLSPYTIVDHVTTDASGKLYVLVAGQRIRVYDQAGAMTTEFSIPSDYPTSNIASGGFAVDDTGRIYIGRTYESAIGIYAADGTHIKDFDNTTAPLTYRVTAPNYIARQPDGTMLVGGQEGKTIARFTAEGQYIAAISPTANFHYALNAFTADADGTVYVYNTYTGNVVSYSFQPSAPPSAPISLTADAASDEAINVAWQAPSTLNGSTVTGYLVEYRRQGDSAWLTATTLNQYQLTYSLTNSPQNPIDPLTTYDVRVAATSDSGNGAYAQQSATTLALPLEAPYAFDGQFGPSMAPSLPYFIAINRQGGVAISNPLDGNVGVYNASGALLRTVAPPTYAPQLYGVAYNSTGTLYVTDLTGGLVHRFAPDGTYEGTLTSPGQMSAPYSVAVGSDDTVYVYDSAGSILVFDSAGTYQRSFSVTSHVGFGLTFAVHDDMVYIIDITAAGVMYKTDGTFVRLFGSHADLAAAGGVAVDSKGTILVVDADNKRVHAFSSVGDPIGRFGTTGNDQSPSGFNYPFSVAFDASDTAYVVDVYNARVMKWRPTSVTVPVTPTQPTTPTTPAPLSPPLVTEPARPQLPLPDPIKLIEAARNTSVATTVATPADEPRAATTTTETPTATTPATITDRPDTSTNTSERSVTPALIAVSAIVVLGGTTATIILVRLRRGII